MGIEATVTKVIPLGKPKSGRDWKVRQTSRFSSQNRQGILKHLSTTYEDKRRQREELSTIKALEKEMKEDTKNKKLEEKQRREEKQKIRMANEYKSTSYQEVFASKIISYQVS